MDFGAFFRLIMDLTGTSIAELARTIAYDRSYVSKWYNRRALPSLEAWEEVGPQLAQYFAQKMRNEHLLELAKHYPRVWSERLSVSTKQLLSSLFDDAFKTSYAEAYPVDIFPAANLSMVFGGLYDFLVFVIALIDKATTNMVSNRDIYVHWDMLDVLTSDIIDDMHFTFTSNDIYRLHFLVNPHDTDMHEADLLGKVHRFLRLASQLPFIEFVPYGCDNINDFQCAFEGVFYAYGTPSAAGDDLRVFVTQNPQVLANGKQKLEAFFSQLPRLIAEEPSAERFARWLSAERPERPPLAYLPALPLYLAGAGLREKLYRNQRISQLDYDVWPELEALYETAAVQNSTLIIPESSLRRVTEAGLVKNSEDFMRLEGDDLADYVAWLQRHLEAKRARGQLHIIPSDVTGDHLLPDIAIYSDGVSAFYLQMNRVNAFARGSLFYPVRSSVLAELLYHFLSQLRTPEYSSFDL